MKNSFSFIDNKIKLMVLFVFFFGLVFTSCERDFAGPTQNSDKSVVDARINALEKLGYSLDKQLSTSNRVCYKLKDTTIFINKKIKLNSIRGSYGKSSSIVAGNPGVDERDFASYRMYSDESIQSGVMSVEAPDLIDDEDIGNDIAFNIGSDLFYECSFVGKTIFKSNQGPGDLWGMPGEHEVIINVTGMSSAIWQLNTATTVDPVGSFVKNL